MGKRTDSREKMIKAADQLFRARGYRGTSLMDVVKASGAPRGSVYFHFPGGKEELGVEVADMVTNEIVETIGREASRSGTAGEFVTRVLNTLARQMARTGYLEGCPLAPVVVEMAAESEILREAMERAFATWLATLAERLTEKGIEDERARDVAELIVAAIEGAYVLGRLGRSREPMENVGRQIAQLVGPTTIEGAGDGRRSSAESATTAKKKPAVRPNPS